MDRLVPIHCGLSTPLIFKRKCAHMHRPLSPVYTHDAKFHHAFQSAMVEEFKMNSYICGYHIFKIVGYGKWLECRRELGNPRNHYTAAVCIGDEIVATCHFNIVFDINLSGTLEPCIP